MRLPTHKRHHICICFRMYTVYGLIMLYILYHIFNLNNLTNTTAARSVFQFVLLAKMISLLLSVCPGAGQPSIQYDIRVFAHALNMFRRKLIIYTSILEVNK